MLNSSRWLSCLNQKDSEGNCLATEAWSLARTRVRRCLHRVKRRRKSLVTMGKSSKPICAAEELAATKFAHIKEWIPIHLIESREVVVLACPDGLVIRFEPPVDRPGITVAWASASLREVVPPLSNQVVFCHPDRTLPALLRPNV